MAEDNLQAIKSRTRFERQKLFLNQQLVDRLHQEAIESGWTEEHFKEWLDDCVIVVEALY